MNKTQQAEYDNLTGDQMVLYGKAEACGAHHEDAMEAVMTNDYTTKPERPAPSLIRSNSPRFTVWPWINGNPRIALELEGGGWYEASHEDYLAAMEADREEMMERMAENLEGNEEALAKYNCLPTEVLAIAIANA